MMHMVPSLLLAQVGAIGLSLGYAFSMESAGKLVPMTYLLVIVNNMEEDLALLYALSRFLGILVGVACLHLSTIIVFQVRACLRGSYSPTVL